MQLTFIDYNLLRLQKNTLLISDCGATKITSKRLHAALIELKATGKKSIDTDELNQIFTNNKLPTKNTKHFLESAINLKAAPDNPYYEKTIILHDWPVKGELEAIASQELNAEHAFFYNDSALIEESKNGAKFIKIINMQYDYSRIKNLYFKLIRLAPASAISVSYLTGKIFHVGQPYINELGNPCHFCIIDRQLNYEQRNPSRNNWTALMRFCHDQNIASPSQHLNLLQRNLAAGAILRKISLHTEYDVGRRFQDNAVSTTSVDLDTGTLTEEIVSHWHSCDCLRT
jgi:McbB family protein